ncbi:hypothetical protein jhhlp_001374 [Lomentospora prolificans]|uniref:Alpha box domain-containing protein n=1 Tax=Lomentospora prolificans TaxID=41688 RepID=A0A2N3NI31_9PEZI|nr:hypothetical protein jhhlp_001374 [Lomentospora prolificans]
MADQATHQRLLAFIAGLSPQQILEILPKTTVNQLTAMLSDNPAGQDGLNYEHTPQPTEHAFDSPLAMDAGQDSPSVASDDTDVKVIKAKRPLNAFIAFRSYYKVIFLKHPQKDVSSYITGLWAGEHFRNKWALIAKVYSFVRDEVGTSDVNLKDFLAVACPIMLIVAPENYLRSIGWIQTHDDEGNCFVTQDKVVAQNINAALESQPSPDTELELLLQCVAAGYMADHSEYLTAKLARKSDTIMTPNLMAANNNSNTGESAIPNTQFYQPVMSGDMAMGNVPQHMASDADSGLQMQNMDEFVD